MCRVWYVSFQSAYGSAGHRFVAAIDSSRALLWLFRAILGFLQPRALQHVRHRVVALVTGVLEQAVCGRLPRILAGPCTLPGRRILDGEAIQERVRVDSPDAFDDMQLIARAVELRFAGEIRGVHDE